MYKPTDIANWFLCSIDREAGDSITHLKLQKLVYYAQAWSLALNNKPLFEEDFQAWSHGPVVPSLFHRFKEFGWDAIPQPNDQTQLDLDKETTDLLEEIYEIYGEHSAKHLELLTHQEKPWKEARGSLAPEQKSETIISKKSLQDFYSEMYRKQNEQQKTQKTNS
jgi:uncharacterized phage-associated protein